MKQESNAFICTPYDILMLHARIERGVQPKVLQQLSGHASIKTTMDRYVHVTE